MLLLNLFDSIHCERIYSGREGNSPNVWGQALAEKRTRRNNMWTCKKIHPYTDIYVITKICAGIGRSLWQVYSCWHDLRTCLQVPTENRYFKCSKSSIFTDEKKIKQIPYSCGVLHVWGGWERVRLNTVILCWFVYINACTHFSYNLKNSKASWF